MRAQVLLEPKPIEQRPLEAMELPRPEPQPGHIRLRVQACGACRTDLHTVEGEIKLPRLPTVPGHQVVGLVDAVGERVSRFRVGDRLGVVWLYRTCGKCSYCQAGRENLCERAEFTGLHADGGYAEFMVVDAEFAYPLPEGASEERIAPLLCGGVIGYRALRLSELRPSETIGLYGFGNSAHVTIQLVRYQGCTVFVFTRSRAHQEHACELGASWVGRAEDDPPSFIDAGIIFAPAGQLVPQALRILRPGGTLVLAGIHMSTIPQISYELLYGERTVRTVANCTRRDATELLELAEKIPIHTDVSLFGLEEANEVLLGMKESRFRGDAVLVP